MKLAVRVGEVSPSLTLVIAAKAKAMKAEGIDVCSFSAGEPDFDTPAHIKAAAKLALDRGKTKYGPTAGEPRLREAIARKLKENGLDYQAKNVIVTNGGKHGLFNLMLALIDPGDEVIIPAPYWLSYPEMVKLAGGVPIIVHTDASTNYKITPQQLAKACTQKTQLFILNSPSNPTGAVYTRSEIQALAEVVVEQDILVISDEIYEKILYDGAEHHSIGSVGTEIFKRTIISSGFAKAYSMTGWRLGYLAGEASLIKAVSTIQGHSTSNVCTFAQYGAIAALESSQDCVEQMRQAFAQRRQVMLERLNAIPGINCAPPDGAFYMFINISKTGLTSLQFCDRLLGTQQVATIPGIAFGADDHIRLSYATDMATIEKGMDRLDKFVQSHSVSLEMIEKTRGTIAAGNPKTAEAGIEIFKLGGNAFDAAVAAVLASFVTESTLTSAAGGGFLLAHTRDNQNILFDFFSQTPRQKRKDDINFYPVEVNFGDAVQEFHIGLGSMAVPGNMAGLFHVHEKLGRLPFNVVAEPAIHYAKSGIEVSEFQFYCLTLLKEIVTAPQEARQVYAPDGELIQPGGKLFMKDFADTLAYLAKKGAREFYKGDIAQQLVKDCQDYGGYLTLEDLKSYQVIEREPLIIDYRGNTFLTNPPPSSGGILIAFALELLSKVDLDKMGFGTSHHLQTLAEVMRLTNEARKDRYNTNIYQKDVDKIFLSSEHVAQYEQELTDVNKWGSTTHISVIDSEGNAASVTTSLGEGSGYVIPGTGIMVNNMLGEEDLNPHGFHQWQENVRISSMMAPTIVLKNDQPEIVLGSGGSNRIRTAILQVISNIVDFKMHVDAAVNDPRVHWENSVFNIEPGFNEEAVRALLSDNNQLTLWNKKSMFFGGVHTVMDLNGIIEGAGDRRRNGAIASTLDANC